MQNPIFASDSSYYVAASDIMGSLPCLVPALAMRYDTANVRHPSAWRNDQDRYSRLKGVQVFIASLTSAFARRIALFGIAILLINAAGAHFASAQNPRPFGGRVVARWDNVFNALPASVGIAYFEGTSQMKHMGRSAQAGNLRLGAPTINGLPGTGTVTITAADGDRVTFKFSGFLNPGTGEGAGPLEITGGTGRFAGATGAGTFYAVIDLNAPANQRMTVLLDGFIRY